MRHLFCAFVRRFPQAEFGIFDEYLPIWFFRIEKLVPKHNLVQNGASEKMDSDNEKKMEPPGGHNFSFEKQVFGFKIHF